MWSEESVLSRVRGPKAEKGPGPQVLAMQGQDPWLRMGTFSCSAAADADGDVLISGYWVSRESAKGGGWAGGCGGNPQPKEKESHSGFSYIGLS